MQRPVIYWRIWGEATALLQRARQLTGVDLLIVLGLAGLLYGLLDLAKEWAGPHRQVVEITLSPTALPKYAFYSLMRGLLAYMLSLGFTLLYGYWAAKDRVAERVLIPLLDILQSIPVLGFLPGLVLGLTAAFPYSNVGLELAAIVMIFTGQVWNMTFSFYQSLRSLPQDMQEVAAAFRLNWWQRLRWLELPGATMGLVWNSMMSMAGGWFLPDDQRDIPSRRQRFPIAGAGFVHECGRGTRTCGRHALGDSGDDAAHCRSGPIAMAAPGCLGTEVSH
jgi:NitT/TauT family transport system permease protein